MNKEADDGPGYLEPKGRERRDEDETNKEDGNVDSNEFDSGQALKDSLFGALFGAAQQQTGMGWQEDTEDLYGLNYETTTADGDQVEITLVAPQSKLGQKEGLEQAVVKDFSLWKSVNEVYILGGEQEHEQWQVGGNQFYAEAHDPEEGERPMKDDELEEVYTAIYRTLEGDEGAALERAVANPQKQGYASAEELVESIKLQLETSYQQALNCKEP